MALSRYSRTPYNNFGTRFATGDSQILIRRGIRAGIVGIKKQFVLTSSQRLDTIAGIEYGESSYWWIIAAASDIGWGLQVPPGTIITVPDLRDVINLVC